MLFFLDFRVTPKELSLDELFDIWEKEAEVAVGALEAGKLLSLYKVSGQRRVVGIIDAESHDELDQILMTLPIAHYVEVQAHPVREYTAFAEDVRNRWGAATSTS